MADKTPICVTWTPIQTTVRAAWARLASAKSITSVTLSESKDRQDAHRAAAQRAVWAVMAPAH
jgi:hypothetical protein